MHLTSMLDDVEHITNNKRAPNFDIRQDDMTGDDTNSRGDELWEAILDAVFL